MGLPRSLGILGALTLGCAPNLTPIEPGDDGEAGPGPDEDGSESATSGETDAAVDDGAEAGDADAGDGDGGDGDGDGDTGDGDGDGDQCLSWDPTTACTGAACVGVHKDWVHCGSVSEYAPASDGSVLLWADTREEMVRIDPGAARTVLAIGAAAHDSPAVFPGGDAYVRVADAGSSAPRIDRFDDAGDLIVSTTIPMGAGEVVCWHMLTHDPGTVVLARGIPTVPGLGCDVSSMHLLRADGSEAQAFVSAAGWTDFWSNRLGLYRHGLQPGTERLDLSGPDWWVNPVWSNDLGRIAALAEDADHWIGIADGTPRPEVVDGTALPFAPASSVLGAQAIDPSGTWWADEFDGPDPMTGDPVRSVRLFTGNALALEFELPFGTTVTGFDVNERGEILFASYVDFGSSTLQLVTADGTVAWVHDDPFGQDWRVRFEPGGDAFLLTDLSWAVLVRMTIER